MKKAFRVCLVFIISFVVLAGIVLLNYKSFLAEHGVHKVNGHLKLSEDVNDNLPLVYTYPVTTVRANGLEYKITVDDVATKVDLNLDNYSEVYDITSDMLYKKASVAYKKESIVKALKSELEPEAKEFETVNYNIIRTANGFEVEPLQFSDGIDYNALAIDVEGAITNRHSSTLLLNDYIKTIPVNEEEHQSLEEYIKAFESKSIKYTKSFELPLKGFLTFYKVQDNHLVLDDSQSDLLNEYINQFVEGPLATLYDDTSEETVDVCLNGEQLTVDNWGVGHKLNKEQELKDIKDILANWETLSEDLREPALYNLGKVSDVSEGNFILIDKSEQTLTCYKDGKEVLSTPVITGLPKGDRDTPTGLFYILQKSKNYQMETVKVKYWLRITWKGHGLHDASWQYNFGGKSYKSHGSHGCINIPPKIMPDIYKLYDCYDTVLIVD